MTIDSNGIAKHVRPLVILLAEDNDDHAELILETLKDFNIANSVQHVSNGEQVLDYLNHVPPFTKDQCPTPDLILLDLKMPRMDGKQALTAIKKHPKFGHLPVVMVSTSGVDSDVNECYKLGANSYVTKPLQFDEFTRKIRELNLYWVLTSEIPQNG